MKLDTELDALANDIDALHDEYVREKARQDEVAAQSETLEANLALMESDVGLDEVCVQLLQGLEASYQAKFQENLSKIVSRGLTLVFDQDMQLKIVTRVLRDVTNVEFRLSQPYGANDVLETNLMGAKGGTVIAIVNVLLRILLILSAHPPMRRIVIMDEPFGLAAPESIPAFGELLQSLSRKLGFQFIIVSHEKSLIDIGDTAYQVYATKRNGSSFEQLHARNERVV